MRLACLHCVGAVVGALGWSFLLVVVADEESALVCTFVLFFLNIHVCIDYLIKHMTSAKSPHGHKKQPYNGLFITVGLSLALTYTQAVRLL